MSEWIEKPLKDLVSFKKGKKVETSDLALDGYQPYLGASSLTGGEDGFAFPAGGVACADNDALMLWDGERSGLVGPGKPGVISSTVMRLRPEGEMVGRYLVHYLRDRFDWIQARRTGTGVPHVPKDLGRILELRFPNSEAMQTKICDILDALDTQIEATEGLIAKQERVRAGLMQDLFTRGVDEHGQLRPPRELAPHLYHQTELGWLPLGWKVVQMGNHIQKIDSGWSPTCDSEPAADDEWGVLKTTAVVWPGYDSTENKRLPDSVKQVASVETKPGDILITRKGPMERVGVAVYVETTRPRLMFPDTVFRTRALPSDALIPRFLVAAMQSEAVQKHWWQRKVGLADAQVNINHGIVRNTPFQLPPQGEQSRILAAISTYEAIQRDYQGELPKLKSAKTGLMQDLLTGKVSVAPLLESAAA